MIRDRLRAALAAVLLFVGGASPTLAGQAEMDLLASYIGSWQGAGVLVGGAAPESFRCRLTVAKGNQAKINYAGRCALVNMNISVSGTIAYNDSARRYEAAMSSNAGFSGIAVGRKSGNNISFDLAEQQTDRGGNQIRIGSQIKLSGGKIQVDFEVEFNNSGEVLTAAVPFSR